VTGEQHDDPDGPPRALIIAAALLGVAAVGVVLLIAANRQAAPQPVALPGASAPQSGAPACKAVAAALPQRLGRYQRAAVAQPAPEGAAAWRDGTANEPVVLRCGLDRPADFVVGSPIQGVDRVQWFQVSAQSEGRSTWYTVDRPVYFALTLPSGSGPAPIQELSEVIDRTVGAVPIDPAPVR
jgi:uncharacterized protein DUF3515